MAETVRLPELRNNLPLDGLLGLALPQLGLLPETVVQVAANGWFSAVCQQTVELMRNRDANGGPPE